MTTIQINIGDDDFKMVTEIFKNEEDFEPRTQEDRMIVEIMRQILKNPKNPYL